MKKGPVFLLLKGDFYAKPFYSDRHEPVLRIIISKLPV
jgi:hypothetical protein